MDFQKSARKLRLPYPMSKSERWFHWRKYFFYTCNTPKSVGGGGGRSEAVSRLGTVNDPLPNNNFILFEGSSD